jgi:hypothetical protein
MPQSVFETYRLTAARKSPSRGEALGLLLAAVFLLYYSVVVVLDLLAGRWESHAGHIVFGVYVVVVTLCVNWRAVRTWRRQLSGRASN